MKPKAEKKSKAGTEKVAISKDSDYSVIGEIGVYPKLSELFAGLQEIDHEYQNDLNSKKANIQSSGAGSASSMFCDKYSEKVIYNEAEFENETLRGLSMLDLQNDESSENSSTMMTMAELDTKCDSLHCEEHCNFQEWISWRTQANGQLVYLILQNSGYDVNIAPWEASRQALSSNTMNSVIEHARSSSLPGTTTLMGKPYIMYGIPRAHVCSRVS